MSTCTATPKQPTASRSAFSTRIGRTSTAPDCSALMAWHAAFGSTPPSHAEPAWRVHTVRVLSTGVSGLRIAMGRCQISTFPRMWSHAMYRHEQVRAGCARTRAQEQHTAPTMWHCFSACLAMCAAGSRGVHVDGLVVLLVEAGIRDRHWPSGKHIHAVTASGLPAAAGSAVQQPRRPMRMGNAPAGIQRFGSGHCMSRRA